MTTYAILSWEKLLKSVMQLLVIKKKKKKKRNKDFFFSFKISVCLYHYFYGKNSMLEEIKL